MADFNAVMCELGLHLLSEEVVHYEWKEGYYSVIDISVEHESLLQAVSIPEILGGLSRDIFRRVQIDATKGWPDLVNEGLDHKRFMYLICYLMSTALVKMQEEEHRTSGICAMRLYFSFLATPHGSPFLIFQPNLYAKALQILQCGYLRKRSMVPSSGRGQGRGSSRLSSDDALSPTSPRNPLPKQESETLRKLLIDGERDLIQALQVSELGREDDALELTVEALSNIAMQEVWNSALLADGLDYNSSSLEQIAFCGLMAICDNRHGDVEETVRVVMRFAFEAIMLAFSKDSKTISATQLNSVRDVFIDFISIVCKALEEKAFKGIFILVQQLCLRAPDRSDKRLKLAESLVCLILKLPLPIFEKAYGIVIVLSCHDKASVRLFAVEVLGRTLSALKVLTYGNEEQDETEGKFHRLLFASVLARVLDCSALVRSQAMSCLTLYMKESFKNRVSKHLLESIFVDPYASSNPRQVPKKKFQNFNEVAKALQSDRDPKVSLPCALTIINKLCEHCDDDKVMVRRAGLKLLLQIFYLNDKFMSKNMLAEVGSHCRDEAVSVKKMMVQEFTNLLLEYPTHQLLIRQWTMDVVPSIFDTEASMVEKVLESLGRTILDNVVVVNAMTLPKHHLPWMLMKEISRLQYHKAFLQACSLWKEERSCKLIPILKSHIGMSKPHNDAAWVTLMCLAQFMTIKEPQFILHFYHEEICGDPNVNSYISQLVIQVLWFTWKQLPRADKISLAQELNTDLMLFKVPVPLISRAVDIRYGLHSGDSEGTDVESPPEWATQLIKKCETNIFDTLKLNSRNVHDEEAMKRFVITLSNACLYYPRLVEKRTTEQLLIMLSSSDGGEPGFWCGFCSGELKAALVNALGKIGLQNEPLAQKLIPEFGRLLSTIRESDVKNNIMICLTDLCTRYTSLGDELLSDMSVCLKDVLQPVRLNALILLVQLIQEDYIKMRNNLTFHLLSMLNDDDYVIVNMTRVFFVDTVLRKKSSCFTSCFVSSVFHYNGYECHYQRSSEAPLTTQEKEVFDISGHRNQDKRTNIYRFMLSHSTDEDRLTILGHLCFNICKAVLDGKILLEGRGRDVLKDCLYVMDCDEIHTCDSRAAEEDEEVAADDEDASEQLINLARKKIFSEVVKKQVEGFIPTLYQLKKKLASSRSPLTEDVMRVLQNIIESNRIDVDSLNNPQLANELKNRRASHEGLSDSDSSGNDD